MFTPTVSLVGKIRYHLTVLMQIGKTVIYGEPEHCGQDTKIASKVKKSTHYGVTCVLL